MKKLAIIVFMAGVVVLGAVLGLRLSAATAPSALPGGPPGEGRLDQADDIFQAVYRSWALGGREASSPNQEKALFRLGLAQRSEMLTLEIRRRELEELIAKAQADLSQVRKSLAAAAPRPVVVVEPATDESEDGDEDMSEEGDWDSEYYPDHSEEYEEDDPRLGNALDTLFVLEEEYRELLKRLDPAELAYAKEVASEIAVLGGGADRGVQMLLARWGLPFAKVKPSLGISTVRDQHVLVIPSGAFDAGMKQQLASFVSNGGTAITFAQRTVKDLFALPGQPRGFGWSESESQYQDAVEVAAAHPSTVALKNTRFSAAVDGFFYGLPKDAEVLLRDARSGQPVAVVYPHGKGLVVATTLFTDWEALSRNPGETEILFLRDLVLWATARGRRLHSEIAAPETKVKLTLPIQNNSKEMAKKVRLCYLTPEGNYGKPFDLDVKMLPGEKENKEVTLTMPKTPGVWHVTYALIRPDGTVLQQWQDAVSVAVGKPVAAASRTGLGVAVTSTGEMAEFGKRLAFSVNLFNFSNTEMEVECICLAQDDKKGGREKNTVTVKVPANGTQAAEFYLTAEQVARGYYEFVVKEGKTEIRVARLQTVKGSAQKGGSR